MKMKIILLVLILYFVLLNKKKDQVIEVEDEEIVMVIQEPKRTQINEAIFLNEISNQVIPAAIQS